jgi:hypothetical protein
MNIQINEIFSLKRIQLKIFLIIIASITFFLTSCKKEITSPQYNYPEPIEYRNSTFPLATSNQWAYADTNYNYYATPPSLSGASLSLLSIDGYTGESNHGKWRLINNIIGSSSVFYSISNDTVFIEDGESLNLNPRIAFLPYYSQDTVKFVGPGASDITKVYSLGHTMETPAGIFDSVNVYEFHDPFTRYIYFRQGVGVICTELLGWNNVLMHKSVLISYVLVK